MERIALLELIDELILEREDELLRNYGADAVQAALKSVAGKAQMIPCLQFIVSNKSSKHNDVQAIPAVLRYDDHEILTDVIEEDLPTEDAAITSPGGKVHREGTAVNGTIGLKVYRENSTGNTDFILSCFHVFCSKELMAGRTKYSNTSHSNIISGNTAIAKVSRGQISSTIDAAIARIYNGTEIDASLKNFPQSPSGIKIVTHRDVLEKTQLFTHGAVRGNQTGIVLASSVNRTVKIGGKIYTFKNVIPVSKMSEPGDSGAPAVDNRGKVAGIIFASNTTTSYLIPISTILVHFKIKMYYA